MCLVALFYRVARDAPIVLGANREEFYARGGAPPCLHLADIPFLAGTDPGKGGTWLGVNQNGLVIAVTNRRLSQRPAEPQSRGLLVRQLLQCPDAAQATTVALRELGRKVYEGCNLLCIDAAQAMLIQAGDWIRCRPLPVGLHVITNGELNDASDPRVQHALHWLGQRGCARASEGLRNLQELCAHHAPTHPPICFRHDNRGTVSSSVLALQTTPQGVDLARSEYWHAQGPPCEVPYGNLSPLLLRLGQDSPSSSVEDASFCQGGIT